MKRNINIDILGGVSLLALCSFFFFQMDSEEFSMFGMFFPEKILPMLALLAVLIIIKGFVKPSRPDKPIFRINSNMVVTLVTGLAWVLLLGRAGFIATSFISLFGLQCVFTPREERSVKSVLLQAVGSLATVLFFHHIFVQYLGVTLPDGDWWE